MSNAHARQRTVIWLGPMDPHLHPLLDQAGWQVREIILHRDAQIMLARTPAAVVLMDLRDSDPGQLKAVEALIRAHPDKRCIALVCPKTLMSPDVATLIHAGCFDYVTAPVHPERLLASLGHAWGMAQLSDRALEHAPGTPEGMLGDSPCMRHLTERIGKFAPVDVPVLITGETGTGKEVAARALHQLSSRSTKPFVAINCGALAPNLVQSELFGHERGAFTGANVRKIGRIEAASDGTVFLDEIGDLPLDAQTSLLRFLQEGTIDRLGSCEPIRLSVRVAAATHVDLEKAVREGRFREDLYYRLNVLRLPVPPLRERGDDILCLARHFLDVFRAEHGAGIKARGFGPQARAALCGFAWPGNVRELINRVRRAAVVAESGVIGVTDLDLMADKTDVRNPPAASLDHARAQAEREAIVAGLQASRFNVSECARRLDVSRVTVYRLCKKHSVALDPVH